MSIISIVPPMPTSMSILKIYDGILSCVVTSDIILPMINYSIDSYLVDINIFSENDTSLMLNFNSTPFNLTLYYHKRHGIGVHAEKCGIGGPTIYREITIGV